MGTSNMQGPWVDAQFTCNSTIQKEQWSRTTSTQLVCPLIPIEILI
jgi:hypothetical protein